MRLRGRVPSAEYIGRARLTGYTLRFHKRGRDGSAKADAFRTGDPSDHVWGAVFLCPEDEKAGLDRAEGLGSGYEETSVDVEMDDGSPETVRLYVADPAAIDETLVPYTWYRRYVVTGAEERALPGPWVEALRRHPAIPDPDPARERRNTPTRIRISREERCA